MDIGNSKNYLGIIIPLFLDCCGGDFATGHSSAATSEVFFKIKLKYFLDTLILSTYFFIIKINNFPVDFSSISAKTATLVATTAESYMWQWMLNRELVKHEESPGTNSDFFFQN